MTHILAILQKRTGRGQLRCWSAFLFDTVVQAEVEEFMAFAHHSHYFLADPDKLEKNDVGNWLYDGLWISATEVHVTTRGIHTSFTIKD